MAPRKKGGSSSGGSKKCNQNNQQPQPPKFGIQHFFDRHTQNSQNPKFKPPIQLDDGNPSRVGLSQGGSVMLDLDLDVSPEISKVVSAKRFKFSPGMLIKQSQDEGGDEVTWRISPVNERLNAKSKQLPGVMRVLADSSRLNSMSIQKCSLNKDSVTSSGKLEKWLSSPPLKALENSLTLSDRASLRNDNLEHGLDFHGTTHCGNDKDKSGAEKSQSPFKTPPSLSYSNNKLGDGVDLSGASDQHDSRQHRKALLDLLDQVGDVLSVDPASDGSKNFTSRGFDDEICTKSGTAAEPTEARRKPSTLCFLVLEVSEKRPLSLTGTHYPIKVLRLLNEQSGEERAVHLYDEWFCSVIEPGDTVQVIGDFDEQGNCDVNREKNFIIVHGDILMSGTRVASSYNCTRRAVLDERLKCSEHSITALIGTLLHQIFQAGLIHENPTKEYLEEYARIVLQKNFESLYACEANDANTHKALTEAIPKMLNWILLFRDSKDFRTPIVDFGSYDGLKKVKISEVVDIEEVAWAPKYGLKGIIDASLQVKFESSAGETLEKIMPLEFKTGKATTGQAAMEHNAQVMLYTLLMSDRYHENIDSGFLYYLHTDQTQGVVVRRSDLVGLLMRRNELADSILKASTTQRLPPMLKNPNICRGCRHLNVCTVYHKAQGGNADGSGLGNLFDSLVGHLTSSHFAFLKKWDRLIDLEAKELQDVKRDIWSSRSSDSGRSTSCLSPIFLETSDKASQTKVSKGNKFVYCFSRQKSPLLDGKKDGEDSWTSAAASVKDTTCSLRSGDYVILSTEPARLIVSSGVIMEISRSHVSVSFSKRLRLPRRSLLEAGKDLCQEVWRIDKDEIMSSFAVMRFNIVQLFLQHEWNSHLRKMIVDLEAPRFDNGCLFTQDPAVSYIRSEETLNDDQRKAILKILAAKDYALILGMPGTGKTSTMVHAVKAFLMRGATILLTSYTNSAIDNLLIKLKVQDIDFIRIGRYEAVHEEVRGHCISATKLNSIKDIKLRVDAVKVVAVTCLGINSPLLANKRFDVCIMDEAGQTTLPVALGPLMFASKFVLVGDHYQLPPLVQSVEARENGMGTSLFCRLSEAHPQAISALQSQYRMCSAIMELSNALIYGNRLRCGSLDIKNAKLKYTSLVLLSPWLQEVLNPDRQVIFINTDMLPALEVKDCKTVNNPIEAYIVSEVTDKLVCRGIQGEDIGIITPYNSQADLIRHCISTHVEIHTIDKYQGRDKDCILVSFVRSSKNPRHYNSSLLGDWHRINVALTRAKKKLVMVGSCRTLSSVPLLKLLIEKVEEQSCVLDVSNNDINYKVELRRCSKTL
ncbi:DNA replication ATP-dependent helicase/nuclease JHS1 [Apium graveolens]|uniref:DNA replication ATP-dependent helicase/nuclease JHS1 n=1 Tax=Apium graveolens TaxID=4045 RepID=UPI003D7A0BC9